MLSVTFKKYRAVVIVPDPYGFVAVKAMPVLGTSTVPEPVLIKPSSSRELTSLVGSSIFSDRNVAQVAGLRKLTKRVVAKVVLVVSLHPAL